MSLSPPVVTGLSPKEGVPGTKVTIRGGNFGSRPSDLIGLTICGFDCLLTAEWMSPNKIVALSGPVEAEGEVIITTKYGRSGTSNVMYKSYYENVGLLKESAVWIEEAHPEPTEKNQESSFSQKHNPLDLDVEHIDNKFTYEELASYFPDKSGNITCINFSPQWFLLENYYCLSFDDLKAGVLHLRRKIQRQEEHRVSFLKNNIEVLVNALDTLVNLKNKFEGDFCVQVV